MCFLFVWYLFICDCCFRLKTFFCIFIKTLVLWKKNVSIAATPYVAAPIRNSALISAGTTTTTG